MASSRDPVTYRKEAYQREGYQHATLVYTKAHYANALDGRQFHNDHDKGIRSRRWSDGRDSQKLAVCIMQTNLTRLTPDLPAQA